MIASIVRVDDAAHPALDPYLRIRERDLVGHDGSTVHMPRSVLPR